jgi:hypothetical protein
MTRQAISGRRICAIPHVRPTLASAVIGNEIYVVGTGNRTNRFYDPASDTWRQGARCLPAVSAPSAALFDGKLYVLGGGSRDTTQGGSGDLNLVQIYRPRRRCLDGGTADAEQAVVVGGGVVRWEALRVRRLRPGQLRGRRQRGADADLRRSAGVPGRAGRLLAGRAQTPTGRSRASFPTARASTSTPLGARPHSSSAPAIPRATITTGATASSASSTRRGWQRR